MSGIGASHGDGQRSDATDGPVAPSTEGQIGASGQNSHSTVDDDSLRQIDQIVGNWSHLVQESAEEQAHVEVERVQFLKEFQDLTDSVIRPTMEMAIERLRTDGGDGLIEEHHLDALHKPRVTLWMSMQGEVASPRQDLNPFLQLDADVANKRITVWEGDMVKIRGPAAPHPLGLRPRSRRNPS